MNSGRRVFSQLIEFLPHQESQKSDISDDADPVKYFLVTNFRTLHLLLGHLRSGNCFAGIAIDLVIGIRASLIPALNAAQVEPSQVLREE